MGTGLSLATHHLHSSRHRVSGCCDCPILQMESDAQGVWMVVRSLLGRDGAVRDASPGSSDLLVRASVLAFVQMNKEEKLQEVRAVEGEVGRVQPQMLAAAAAVLHAPDFERSARSDHRHPFTKVPTIVVVVGWL